LREFEEACRTCCRRWGRGAAVQHHRRHHPLRDGWRFDGQVWHLGGAGNISMTNGSQQALDLVGKLFVEPGAASAPPPDLSGALQAWKPTRPAISPSPGRPGHAGDEIRGSCGKTKNPACSTFCQFRQSRRHHHAAGTRCACRDRAREDLVLVETIPTASFDMKAKTSRRSSVCPERTIYLSTFSKPFPPASGLVTSSRPNRSSPVLYKQSRGRSPHGHVRADDRQRHLPGGFIRQHVKKLRWYTRSVATPCWSAGAHWPADVAGPVQRRLFLGTSAAGMDTRELLPRRSSARWPSSRGSPSIRERSEEEHHAAEFLQRHREQIQRAFSVWDR